MKREKRETQRDAKIKRLLEVESHGFTCKYLNPSHYRINGRLDLYIKNYKYHDIATNERGIYDIDPLPFVLSYDFKKKRLEVPHYILKPKNGNPRNIKRELENKNAKVHSEIFGGRKVEYIGGDC